MDKLDEKLIKKAYGLISKKYSTEGGKKFILHLVSSFVINDPISISMENSNKLESLECCITRSLISPINSPVPSSESATCYGMMSKHSDKIICNESLEALNRFIKYRSSIGDDIISKILNYMSNSKKDKKTPSSKNSYPKNKMIKKSNATHEDVEAIPSK